MSATASELSSPIVDAYRAHPSRAGFDELVDANGVRPHAEALAATVEGMGIGGLLAARAEAVNQVADEGISYGAAASGVRQPWLVDPLPLPLDGADWLTLERGLAQRATLLDAVLADLYSDRTLLRRRVLPAAAVLGHPGFTRTADGIGTANRRQLVLTATDVGRDATGVWRVISDRTQAPAGAGYAMATRRIVSRVLAGLHRTSDLARLRGFFHAMTGALLDAAPGGTEIPRVVLLSPGAASETAFDQGFLATMLGFPLAEADDLVVSKGRVWLRAGGELEPVDVILRRVEAMLSDPLEFRGNSEVGLPGMVETARQGAVTIVNPVGAGVLDNPALIAHLRPVAQALLGEDPLLDSPDTWWCGDPAQASHVLANLDEPGDQAGRPHRRDGRPLRLVARRCRARRARRPHRRRAVGVVRPGADRAVHGPGRHPGGPGAAALRAAHLRRRDRRRVHLPARRPRPCGSGGRRAHRLQRGRHPGQGRLGARGNAGTQSSRQSASVAGCSPSRRGRRPCRPGWRTP